MRILMQSCLLRGKTHRFDVIFEQSPDRGFSDWVHLHSRTKVYVLPDFPGVQTTSYSTVSQSCRRCTHYEGGRLHRVLDRSLVQGVQDPRAPWYHHRRLSWRHERTVAGSKRRRCDTGASFDFVVIAHLANWLPLGEVVALRYYIPCCCCCFEPKWCAQSNIILLPLRTI